MLGPGYRFQPLLLHFILATEAGAIFLGANALQRFVDHISKLRSGARLSKQKLLGIRIRGFVCKIHRRIVVGLAPFFFRSRDGLHQSSRRVSNFFL